MPAHPYRALLCTPGLEASMSRTANPYENAAAKGFFSTLKTECYAPLPLPPRPVIFVCIETVGNRTRLHSALGF